MHAHVNSYARVHGAGPDQGQWQELTDMFQCLQLRNVRAGATRGGGTLNCKCQCTLLNALQVPSSGCKAVTVPPPNLNASGPGPSKPVAWAKLNLKINPLLYSKGYYLR